MSPAGSKHLCDRVRGRKTPKFDLRSSADVGTTSAHGLPVQVTTSLLLAGLCARLACIRCHGQLEQRCWLTTHVDSGGVTVVGTLVGDDHGDDLLAVAMFLQTHRSARRTSTGGLKDSEAPLMTSDARCTVVLRIVAQLAVPSQNPILFPAAAICVMSSVIQAD